MEINRDEVVIDGTSIGEYDLYDTNRLIRDLTPDEQLQKLLLQDSQTTLEILHNAADQRVISSFQIVHRP